MGLQTYIVTPLIEESEELGITSATELYKELEAGALKGISVALLHGKMKAGEKDNVLRGFRDGEIKVLVSTTVIEVGIDVPNATTMVIMNAERFGLSQLHQLRGRVGRGQEESHCFILGEARAEETKERFTIFESSNDGFEIAQKDLELRGPGQFLGSQQHGTDGFQFITMAQNMEILQQTKEVIGKLQPGEETNKLQQLAFKKFGRQLEEIVLN